jgi:phosphoglycolate phosphatase
MSNSSENQIYPKSTTYKLVIFDFDDTILHLNVDWWAVKEEIISLAKQRGENLDFQQHIISLTNTLSFSMKNEIDEIFYKHESVCVDSQNYEAFPEMIQLIKDLNNYQLGIVSGNCVNTIKKALSDLGVYDCFSFICGRELVPVNKPDPAPILKTMETLKSKKEETIFIGNSIVDELAAESAGVSFYRIKDPRMDAGVLRGKLI